ncbi:glycosyltransferase involved in cell wall biosynthesis [Paraburkholderia sp. EB58]|jgi:glycosyltransferase involved in cell wall biosynthesis|uniref:glycosyltransferase family 4 protein n=1 Tax=Paraburkholderia sp. EB58 TaxID=3035125 RepID=UPI003D224948
MHILHIVLTPRHSGAEILACGLAETHAAGGATCGIAALNPSEPDFVPLLESLAQHGVQYMGPAHAGGRVGRMLSIMRAYRDFAPDIVVAHSVIPSAYARVAARLSGTHVPIVSVLHSATNDDYSSVALRLSEYLLRFTAAAIVTVNNAARQNYEARFGDGRRLETIPNGTQIDRFRFDMLAGHRLRASFGVEDQTTVLLQVGRVVPVKNQASSVLALKKLVDAGHDAVLWFAGLTEDDAYRQTVVEQIAALELSRHVVWLGSRSDVPALLSAADIYLMPSVREAHSVAMIEALASGIPMVVSEIDAFTAIVRFAGVISVVSTDSSHYALAVEKFIGNRRRYERDLGAFSVERVGERYFDLFRQILAEDEFNGDARRGAI